MFRLMKRKQKAEWEYKERTRRSKTNSSSELFLSFSFSLEFSPVFFCVYLFFHWMLLLFILFSISLPCFVVVVVSESRFGDHHCTIDCLGSCLRSIVSSTYIFRCLFFTCVHRGVTDWPGQFFVYWASSLFPYGQSRMDQKLIFLHKRETQFSLFNL